MFQGLQYALLFIVILVILTVAFCIIAIRLWLEFAKLSITFPRLATAAFIAGGIYFLPIHVRILNSGFWNFILVTAIFFGIITVLSMLPRVYMAMGSFCIVGISLFVCSITVAIGALIYDSVAKPETKFMNSTLFWEIIGLIVLGLTIYQWIKDLLKGAKQPMFFEFPSNRFTRMLGRIIASFLYGFSFYLILFLFTNGFWLPSVVVQYIILFAFSIIAFVADLLIVKKGEII